MEYRVNSFRDQSEDRHNIFELCSRFACDIISLIDDSTGTQEDSNDEELTKEYMRFRDWLGPNVVQMAQSCIVGPLLNGIKVYDDNTASFELGSFAKGRYRDEFSTMRARIRWICSEVPSLISAYGELYDHEVEPAGELINRALEATAQEDLPDDIYELAEEIETLYLHCCPGARVVRGDEKDIASARETALEAMAFINKEFERRAEVQRRIDSGELEGETTEEKVSTIESSIRALDSEIESLVVKISSIKSERSRLVHDLEEAERLGNAS